MFMEALPDWHGICMGVIVPLFSLRNNVRAQGWRLPIFAALLRREKKDVRDEERLAVQASANIPQGCIHPKHLCENCLEVRALEFKPWPRTDHHGSFPDHTK